MAYATVEDDTSSIELLCFSRTLERFGRQLQEGSAVLVQGKLSVRDDKPPQILCDAVYALAFRYRKTPAARAYFRETC